MNGFIHQEYDSDHLHMTRNCKVLFRKYNLCTSLQILNFKIPNHRIFFFSLLFLRHSTSALVLLQTFYLFDFRARRFLLHHSMIIMDEHETSSVVYLRNHACNSLSMKFHKRTRQVFLCIAHFESKRFICCQSQLI